MAKIPRFQGRYEVPIKLRRRVEIEPPARGFRTEETGEVITHVVEVDIDIDAIVRVMGEKAVTSKGGKARDGYVTVKRCNQIVRRTPPDPNKCT